MVNGNDGFPWTLFSSWRVHVEIVWKLIEVRMPSREKVVARECCWMTCSRFIVIDVYLFATDVECDKKFRGEMKINGVRFNWNWKGEISMNLRVCVGL